MEQQIESTKQLSSSIPSSHQSHINKILAEQGLSWEDIALMQRTVVDEIATADALAPKEMLRVDSEAAQCPEFNRKVVPNRAVEVPLKQRKHLGTTMSTKDLSSGESSAVATHSSSSANVIHTESTPLQQPDAAISKTAGNTNSRRRSADNTPLQDILSYLIEKVGFATMYETTKLNCFVHNPSLSSSLKVLRQENMKWARRKLVTLYDSTVK